MAVSFAACDNVDEADRLIYVEPQQSARCVLVEEYSGQFCVNCPDGAIEIERIQQTYGKDTVIVVTIHAGNLALKENEYPGWVGLANELGEKLYESVGKPAQPAAVIDRRTAAIAKADWMGAITSALQIPSSVNISIEKQYDASTRQLDVTVKAKAALDYNGKLHVWLTENNIVAYQEFKTTHDEKYIHNHILRTSMTADQLAGDDISLTWNDEQATEYKYSITLRDDYKPEDMTIVAFVDNADGVGQTTSASIIE